MNNEKIKSLLDRVKDIVKIHNEHANKQGEKFNIFSILRMDRKEVKTHSNFIYELLNPKGSHGQGDVFLKSFAEIVLNSEVPKTATRPQQEDLTTENRRIDFTLETDKNFIGIEMKIDAYDQWKQLCDYQQELSRRAKNANKGTRLFYLTLGGSEAEQYSHDSTEYECISFKVEILDWIQDCIKQSAEKSVLREALIQYKILLEKLTGENMDINTEVAKLLKDKESFQVAQVIQGALQSAKVELQVKFWSELLEELGEDFYFGNKNNANETRNKNDIRQACQDFFNKTKNQQLGIGYNFKTDSIEPRLMLVHWGIVHYCILQNAKDKGGNYLNIEQQPLSSGWFRSKELQDNYDFTLGSDSEILDVMFDDNKRKEVIKKVADEFKELVEKIKTT